jgi:hypothetical protein
MANFVASCSLDGSRLRNVRNCAAELSEAGYNRPMKMSYMIEAFTSYIGYLENWT